MSQNPNPAKGRGRPRPAPAAAGQSAPMPGQRPQGPPAGVPQQQASGPPQAQAWGQRGGQGPPPAQGGQQGGPVGQVGQQQQQQRPPSGGQAWGPPPGARPGGAGRGRGAAQQPQAPQQPQVAPQQPQQQPNVRPPIQQLQDLQLAAVDAPAQPRPIGRGAGAGAAPGAEGPVGQGRGAIRGRAGGPGGEIVTPTRPPGCVDKKGTTGTVVRLKANYFVLETYPQWCLYQYRVDFEPEEDRTHAKRAMMRIHEPTIGGFVFDGTTMWTSQRLEPDPLELMTTRRDGSLCQIKIRLVTQLSMGDFGYIQVFNNIMKRCYHGLNLQLVRDEYFDAAAAIDIPRFRLQIWPGYRTSINQQEAGLMMCADLSHKIMRRESVLDMLTEIVRQRSQNVRADFEKAIIGECVLTEYNNKTYRIDGVYWDKTPMSTFAKKDAQVTFHQYYQEKYGLTIRDKNQPLLIHRSRERDIRAGQSEEQLFVPELCRPTGLTENMRRDFQLMRAVADETRISPTERINRLGTLNRRLTETASTREVLQRWEMRLSPNLVEFGGRIIPPEEIHTGRNTKVQTTTEVDWTNHLRASPMFISATFKTWTVICPDREAQNIRAFVQTLIRVGRNMSFDIPQPDIQMLQSDRTMDYARTIESVTNEKGKQDLIMCVVSNNNAEKYSAIKKKCCLNRPVATQVILAKNLSSKGVMSIATKVAIQINCKIGGAPWSMKMPLSDTMYCGFDVCHDTNNRGKSFGAFVASMDKPMTKYYSCVSHHSTGEEFSNNMPANMMKAIRKFQQYNSGKLPVRIFMYRDGVGDGQIPYVHRQEVEGVKSMLERAYKEAGQPPARMAYIIVSKRINTRLFTQKGQNPLPGTVADDVITVPSRYDFFLVSQVVRQGTVSPTMYNVIDDSSGLKPDQIQILTYKLTHLYYNWSGTCKVPAPCQFAHKLAFLVGKALFQAPHPDLEDTLYFL